MDLESGVNPPNRFSFYEYFKRGFNYKQMDIENSLQQMMDLCTNPKKVYATSKFHKRMSALDEFCLPHCQKRNTSGPVTILLLLLFLSS